jgi:hypothetical protein
MRVVEPAGDDPGAVTTGDGHLLAAGQPEQRQRGGDLRQGVIVDVVAVGQGGLVRDPCHLPEPAVGVRLGELIPWGRSEDGAGIGGVCRDEREQLGDGPQVVVYQPGVDHFGSLPVAAGPAGRVGVPPAERRRLLGGCRRVAEDVAGVAEGSGQPAVKAQQAGQPFLADG